MSNSMDEMISKSLDEIDALVNEINKGETTEVISKAIGEEDKDVSPEEVSNDAPQEDEPEDEQEDTPEEDAGEEDTDVDSDNEAEEDSGEDEGDYEKSLEEELNSNDSVRKAIEVSEFLNELVKGVSTVLTGHSDRIGKSISAQESSNELLAKSLQGIVKSQKAVLDTQTRLMKSISELTNRVSTLEATPQVRKSVPSAKAVEKSFNASAGDVSSASQQSISKSMALSKLTEAVQNGKQEFVQDILALESTGDMNSLTAGARNLLNLG